MQKEFITTFERDNRQVASSVEPIQLDNVNPSSDDEDDDSDDDLQIVFTADEEQTQIGNEDA